MTVTQSDRLVQYVSAGGATVYNYDFRITNEADIQVDRLRNDVVTTLVLNVDYTVQNVGNTAGGTITLAVADTANDVYAIYGINEYGGGNYSQATGFRSVDSNSIIDKTIEIGQQNRRDIDRSMRAPLVDDNPNMVLPTKEERKGKYPFFDAVTGDLIVSESIGIDTSETVTIDSMPVVWDGTTADRVKMARQFLLMPPGTTAERPAVPIAGMVRYNTDLGQIEGYTGGLWQNLLTAGTGAPINASYIVRQSDGTLTNETALGDLATGILKNTTGTGDPTIAVQGTDYYAPAGTDVAVADGGTGASNAPAARANLGVAIDVDVQAYDDTLQSISGLGTAADKMLYTTGVNTWAESDITAAGRAILDDATAADQRTTLGLGTIATQNANAVAITGGTIAGITDLAVADGGTGASNAAGARTNLGVVIGTDVQAYDATLAALAAYNTNGIVTQTAADTFTGRTITAGDGVAITNGNGVAGNPTVAFNINGLTADAIPDGAADYVATYDASAGTHKKVLLNNLPGGGGGSGSWVKISSKIAANSGAIDFTGLSNAYNSYCIVLSNIIPVSNGVSLFMRTSTNNGTSYDVGASDYNYRLAGAVDNSIGANSGTNAAQIKLTGLSSYVLGNGTAQALFGTIGLYNIGSANRTYIQGNLSCYNSSNLQERDWCDGFRNSATAVNAVQLTMSSGNISSGTFILYGLEA